MYMIKKISGQEQQERVKKRGTLGAYETSSQTVIILGRANGAWKYDLWAKMAHKNSG